MRSSNVRVGLAAFALVAVGATCLPAFANTQAEGAVSAQWTPKQVKFVYMGFTSRYSCDGLRDKIRVILRDFGARDDMEVSESPCPGPLGRPTKFPGVNIKINVLQPTSGTADSQAVSAHWKRVELPGPGDAVLQAGDCELVEQVKHSILPLFTARDVQYHSTCIPNQLSIGATSLAAEVLVPDQPTAKPAPAP